MLGMGIWEIVLVLVVALVALGPERLPALARQIGRGLATFRRMAADLRFDLEDDFDADLQGKASHAPQIVWPKQEPATKSQEDVLTTSQEGEGPKTQQETDQKAKQKAEQQTGQKEKLS